MSVQPKMSGSMMCEERMRQRAYQLHRSRLAAVKPCVDNKTPESCAYAPRRAEHASRWRNREIEEQNHKLVGRMVDIMEGPSGIDNREPWRHTNATAARQRNRQLHAQRIAHENARILDRLTTVAPTYDSVKLDQDRSRNEVFAERISRYPYQPFDRSDYRYAKSKTDLQAP